MVVLLCLYNTLLTKVPSYERLEYLGIVVPKYSDLNILFKMGLGTWMFGIDEGEMKCLLKL